jgi:hypothetical protein
MRALQIAAAVLLVGGIAAVIGSFSTWGACPLEPCGGEFGLTVLYERSGIEFGLGIVTAILGALLAVLGILAPRTTDRRLPSVGVIAAGGVLIAVGVHLVLVYGGDIVTGSPYLGLYITVVGGVVSLIASVRLRSLRGSRPSP